MVSAIDGCSLGALCVPETWFDKVQVEIRQRRSREKGPLRAGHPLDDKFAP